MARLHILIENVCCIAGNTQTSAAMKDGPRDTGAIVLNARQHDLNDSALERLNIGASEARPQLDAVKQPMLVAMDRNDVFVEVPIIAEPTAKAAVDLNDEGLSEPRSPKPDCLMRDYDPKSRQQVPRPSAD